MDLSLALLLSFCAITSVYASPCDSVEGKWYNQLGSELVITRLDEGGKLNGEFRTAVEKAEGAAGDTYAVVRGLVKPDPTGHLLGFSAVFNGGNSVTSWIGQCKKCGEKEVLHTTWVLRSNTDNCLDHWKSTLINEDVFRRDPSDQRPRAYGRTTLKRSLSEAVTEMQLLQQSSLSGAESVLKGKWYTTDGSELEVISAANGTVQGSYRSTNSKVTEITGNVIPWNSASTFAMSGVREDLNAIEVWVGQHHRCADGNEILETSRLRHVSDSSCDGHGETTGFRRMSFTRTQPSKSSENDSWGISSAFNNFANKVSSFFNNLVGK